MIKFDYDFANNFLNPNVYIVKTADVGSGFWKTSSTKGEKRKLMLEMRPGDVILWRGPLLSPFSMPIKAVGVVLEEYRYDSHSEHGVTVDWVIPSFGEGTENILCFDDPLNSKLPKHLLISSETPDPAVIKLEDCQITDSNLNECFLNEARIEFLTGNIAGVKPRITYEDDDLGSELKAIGTETKNRHKNWKQQNLEILKKSELEFRASHENEECLLFRERNKPKVDFYPSTGRWKVAGVKKTYSGHAEKFLEWYSKQDLSPKPSKPKPTLCPCGSGDPQSDCLNCDPRVTGVKTNLPF